MLGKTFHCTTKNNKFPRTHFLGESYQPPLSVGNYLSFCWILRHGDQRFMLNGTLLLTTVAISLAELERLTVTISPVGLETQNSILRKKHWYKTIRCTIKIHSFGYLLSCWFEFHLNPFSIDFIQKCLKYKAYIDVFYRFT